MVSNNKCYEGKRFLRGQSKIKKETLSDVTTGP